MIKLLGKLPNTCYVAVSGGVDSMCAYYFICADKNRKVIPVFFNHLTETSKNALAWLQERLPNLIVEKIKYNILRNKEAYWREHRYNFLESLDAPVITAHHLNDCVETYLFSAFHGKPKLIPYSRNNIIRPFLLTPKEELIKYMTKHKYSWIEDETNKDVYHPRNRIRHNIIPEVLQINPGINSTIRKMIIDKYNREQEVINE
jgi:tRNA(Ile)-lysidine synthase